MDADTLPPPVRLDNQTDVALLYRQADAVDGTEQSPTSAGGHLRTFVAPQSSVDYAWDDYGRPQAITLTVFGSKSVTYDLTSLGSQQPLVYENYFYIQLSATFDVV
jgi:hypothetical protein